MPVYEYECPQGHVTEHLMPDDIVQLPCQTCMAERARGRLPGHPDITARRVLSPTRTTFKYADTTSKI